MNSKALREKRAQSLATIKRLRDAIAAESRDFNTEERAEWDKANAEYDSLTKQIEAAERVEELERDNAAPVGVEQRIGREDRSGEQSADRSRSAATEETRELAFGAWCRRQFGQPLASSQVDACRLLGFDPSIRGLDIPLMPTRQYRQVQAIIRATPPSRIPMIQNELRTLSAAIGASGAFTILPESLVRSLEVNMLAFGGVRQVAETIRTTTGERMTWPTADDTSNTGEQLGENTSIGSSVDPSFSKIAWDAYKFSSKTVLVPFELMQDSQFDLASLIGEMLGERLGRITNTRFTTGDGAAKPRGIVTASSLGVTAASATAIAADELIDLVHSVDIAYRGGAGWMFHDGILKALRKLKASTGEYLWQPGLTMGLPGGVQDTLLGYPYTANQDMQSTVATATKTILFGQLSKYKIRTVGSVRLYRMEERYRDSDQDGFVAFIREDGNLLNAGTSPVKHLLQA